MSATNLFTMARSKLSRTPSGDSRDSFSLHRWVLLKNSIFQSPPLSSSSANTAAATPLPDDDGDDDTDADSFMFPDAGKLMQGISTEAAASEAAWLDSLLETLGEDDDDDASASAVPVDDDEELPPSPPISPMSSSDDLHCYPFLVPYPPYSPPPSLPHIYSTYVDPLPYCDFDDFEDLPVPDAVEDTASDDESESAPPTPGQSLSSLTLDPASIPLPPEHSRLRHSSPHIYIPDDDGDFFYPFDPLPFAYNQPPPSLEYTEC